MGEDGPRRFMVWKIPDILRITCVDGGRWLTLVLKNEHYS